MLQLKPAPAYYPDPDYQSTDDRENLADG